jgi:hypothetical protein
MGIRKPDFEFNNSVEQLRKELRSFFLKQLLTLNLTTEQISKQSFEELATSLETVNGAIEHADSFGVFYVKISALAGGTMLVITSKTESHFEMGIQPLLLEAKKLILDRRAELRKQEYIESLEQLVNRVSDNSLREKLSLELSNLNSQFILLRNKFGELEKQQSRVIDELQAHSAKQIAQLANNLKLVRHGRAAYRSLLGALIGILGIYTVLYMPHHLNWQWLLSHPKKIPIRVSLSLVTLGLSWAIIDGNGNRRWFAFGSIAVTASLGLLGLL